MLSRTADALYWMARYTERAENTARMLDVSYQSSLLPQSDEMLELNWRKLLTISKLEESYDQQYSSINRTNIMTFMISDRNNPSSIYSCLRSARENARTIRGRITSELWETQNTTWLEFLKFLERNYLQDPANLLDWIKYRCHLARGVIVGTMLKNEAYFFIHIGILLERADNTARIIETRYKTNDNGNQLDFSSDGNSADEPILDFYHWAALLRSVSAFEIYRQIYSDHITPKQVADLLIFNPQLPRSLVSSVNELIPLLQQIKNKNSYPIERLVGKLKADLEFSNIEEVFQDGLENFTKKFLERINHIANVFSNTYLIPLTV